MFHIALCLYFYNFELLYFKIRQGIFPPELYNAKNKGTAMTKQIEFHHGEKTPTAYQSQEDSS